MQQIMRLRNDWSVLSDDDVTEELRQKVEAVVRPLGGEVRRGRHGAPVRPELNGYEGIA